MGVLIVESPCRFTWYDTSTGAPHACTRAQHGSTNHICDCDITFVPVTPQMCEQEGAHNFKAHYSQVTGEMIPAVQRFHPASSDRMVTEITSCWRCGTSRYQDHNAESYTKIGPPRFSEGHHAWGNEDFCTIIGCEICP